MQRLTAVLGIAAAMTAASQPARAAANPKPRTACELLSASEVAAFLKVPAAHIDSINSGMNDMTKVDFCNWYVKEGQPEGVMFKLRQAESPNGVMPGFMAARIDEEFSANDPDVPDSGRGHSAPSSARPDSLAAAPLSGLGWLGCGAGTSRSPVGQQIL